MRWRRKEKQSEPTPPKTLADLADEDGVIRLGGAGGGRGEPGRPGKHARIEVGPDGEMRFTVDESGGEGGSA